jgi:putative FmdB family regulatory protein
MPAYDYKCPKCNEIFTVYKSIKEIQEGIKCPKCGNTEVQRIYSPFHAVTSKKS